MSSSHHLRKQLYKFLNFIPLPKIISRYSNTLGIKHLYFLLIFMISLWVSFYNINNRFFSNWDEAWYGEMTRQMIVRKEYIIPIYNGEFYFDKPPLYLWFSVAFAYFFGISEMAVRLTSVLSGLILLMLLAYFVYKKWGLMASFFSYTSLILNPVYINRMRDGNLDASVALGIFISYLLMVSKFKYKFVWLGLVFGLLYLLKASIVFFPIGVLALHEICIARTPIRKRIFDYAVCLSLFLLLPGIWLAAGYQKQGWEFLNFYLFKTDWGTAHAGLKYAGLEYVMYSIHNMKWYTVLVVTGLFLFFKRLRESEFFLLFFFSISLLLLLSFSPFKNDWYLIPSMPFWSLSVGYSVSILLNRSRNKKLIAYLIIINVLIFLRMISQVIFPIMSSNVTYFQVQASLMLKKMSQPKDVVVRLDELYPVSIYYTERKTYSSPPADRGTSWLFVNRKDFPDILKLKYYDWLIGTPEDVNRMKVFDSLGRWKYIYANKEEVIVKLKNEVACEP